MFKHRNKENNIIIPNISMAEATQIAFINAPRAMQNCSAHYKASLHCNRNYMVLWGDGPGMWVEADNFDAIVKFIHKNWVPVNLVKADTVRKDFHPQLRGTSIYAGYFVTNGGMQVQVTVCDVTDGFWPPAYDMPNSMVLPILIGNYIDHTLV